MGENVASQNDLMTSIPKTREAAGAINLHGVPEFRIGLYIGMISYDVPGLTQDSSRFFRHVPMKYQCINLFLYKYKENIVYIHINIQM